VGAVRSAVVVSRRNIVEGTVLVIRNLPLSLRALGIIILSGQHLLRHS